MVKKLYLIRHGETEGAELNRYKGHIDVPLSEKGIQQMEQLSRYIVQNCSNPPSPPFGKGGMGGLLTAVYTSDLSRAVKSAEIIAEPFGLKPVVISELRERNFGIWEGMSYDEIKAEYPQEFKAWAANPLRFSPMKGESTLEVKDRAIEALNKILNNHIKQSTLQTTGGQAEHPPNNRRAGGQNTDKDSLGSGFCNLGSESIAIVAHGGINRIILCHVLEIPLENIFRIEQDFSALNIIEFYNTYPVVKLINYVVHNCCEEDLEGESPC